MAAAEDRRGAPHPRDRHVLVGHEDAARVLADANAADRLHHAWLVGGPEGVGKATLAYRFARRLLASQAEHTADGDGLGVLPDGRTARQISAGAHPNLIAVERVSAEGDKTAPKAVSVEAVRRALSFFNSTAANGGRRICIIDSFEDLTLQAANALLKTIEEPPAGALILIVSHAPQRVLQTVRSRCRKLNVKGLSPGEVGRVLATLGPASVDRGLIERAAEQADGSVSRALALLDAKRLALLDEVAALVAALPGAPAGRVLALAEKLGDRRREAEFTLAVDAVLRWLSHRIEEGQHLGAARLAPLAEVCEDLIESARALEVYNLDRRAFIVSMFGELAGAVRRAA